MNMNTHFAVKICIIFGVCLGLSLFRQNFDYMLASYVLYQKFCEHNLCFECGAG